MARSRDAILTRVSTDADPYAPLAAVYDEWHEALTPIWVLRVETHLARFGVMAPELSFLDMGCGTGTLLVALRHRHAAWRLAGLDASAAMLAEARKKPRAESITWQHARFEAAPELGRFDAVGCFFDAFDHLLEVPALSRALQAAAAALVPGGLLIFDVNAAYEEDHSTHQWTMRRWKVRSEGRYDRATRLHETNVEISGRLDEALATTIVRRCFTADEIGGALAGAGLTTELAERWSHAPGRPASKTWYVVRKPR